MRRIACGGVGRSVECAAGMDADTAVYPHEAMELRLNSHNIAAQDGRGGCTGNGGFMGHGLVSPVSAGKDARRLAVIDRYLHLCPLD